MILDFMWALGFLDTCVNVDTCEGVDTWVDMNTRAFVNTLSFVHSRALEMCCIAHDAV